MGCQGSFRIAALRLPDRGTRELRRAHQYHHQQVQNTSDDEMAESQPHQLGKSGAGWVKRTALSVKHRVIDISF